MEKKTRKGIHPLFFNHECFYLFLSYSIVMQKTSPRIVALGYEHNLQPANADVLKQLAEISPLHDFIESLILLFDLLFVIVIVKMLLQCCKSLMAMQIKLIVVVA